MNGFNEQASALIESLYDFALCRRPDGSIYGIADGTQCRKGSPTQADEEVSREQVVGGLKDLARRSRGGKLNQKQEKAIDEAFAKLTEAELTNISNSSIATLSEGLRRRDNEEAVSRFPKLMSWEEIDGLNKNRERLLRGFEDPSLLTSNLRKVREEEVDAFLLIADKGFSGGDGLKGGKGTERLGLKEDGTYDTGGSDWRKRMLARRFLEQEGKDLYTGLPLAKVDAALEHIKPYSSGHEIAERAENWGWISRVVNDRKEGTSMQEFFERHVDPVLAKGKDKYSKEYEQIMGPETRAWQLSKKNIEANQEFAERMAHAYRNDPRKVLTKLRLDNNNDVVRYGRAHSGVPYFDKAPMPRGGNYGTAIIRNWGRLDYGQRRALIDYSNDLVNKTQARKQQGNPMSQSEIGAEAENFFASLGFI